MSYNADMAKAMGGSDGIKFSAPAKSVGCENVTNTGKAGAAVGLPSSLGMSGPVVNMGGPKNK